MDMRKILDKIIEMAAPATTVNESKFGKGIEVMSLDQFVDQEKPTSKKLDEFGGGFNPKHTAQANKERLDKEHKETSLQKKMAKQAWNSKYGKPTKPKADLWKIAQIIMDEVGNAVPDGDPIDLIVPRVAQLMGHKDSASAWAPSWDHPSAWDIVPILDKAARKHLHVKDYNEYLANMWDSYSENLSSDEQAEWENPWREVREDHVRYSPEIEGISTEELKHRIDQLLLTGQKPDKYVKELLGRRGRTPDEEWEDDGVLHCDKCNHEVKRHANIKELDEAFKLGGASGKDISTDELKGYLDRIINKTKEKSEKYKMPYIHGSNVKGIVDSSGKEYDLEKLKDLFIARPAKILKQNEKMKHSDGTSSIFFNIGLPALVGLAYDEEDHKFVVVNTCPGAGNCKTFCYVMKGGYIQYAPPSTQMTRVLNFLLNDPEGFKTQISNEIAAAEAKYTKKGTDVVVRWHDAGDFFSPQYLSLAYSIAKAFPNVLFYAYTKIASVAKGQKPDNFVINFSMGAQPTQEKQIDYKEVKHSKVVPEVLFKDLLTRVDKPGIKPDKKGKVPTMLVYKDKKAIKVLKDRIAAKYSIDANTLLTYDEMMKTPKGEPGQYNVIVKPGDGDISASRRDVLGTYLLEH